MRGADVLVMFIKQHVAGEKLLLLLLLFRVKALVCILSFGITEKKTSFGFWLHFIRVIGSC